jgi:DNA-binding NarL/FixJ family response regulator
VNPIRVVLAEDHHMVRKAFAGLVEKEADINVIGSFADTATLVEVVRALQPDVLLLSAYKRREYVVGLVRAGVSGCILKHDSPEMLVRAVRSVASGDQWLSPRVAEILMKSVRSYEERPKSRLTRREIEILQLPAAGYRNEEIAERLVITYQTVKNHIRKIFRKLGVETRVEPALYAVNQDLSLEELGEGEI